MPLTYKDMKSLRTTLLHESLFSFYKTFYNYLSAKNLYSSGTVHWINVTIYYANFFLAQAINVLCGKRSYRISNEKFYFIPQAYELLYSNNNKRDKKSYTMTLDLNIKSKNGELIFHKRGINSHQDVWMNYINIDSKGLGLTKITYEELFENNPMHLTNERNIENYTFDGYDQIDFNLEMGNFESFFERDYLKKKRNLVYDAKVGVVLGVFSELYHLYNSFDIKKLPLELEKLKHMVQYMVEDMVLRQKLLNLIDLKFPKNNQYIEEMNLFYAK